MQHFWDCNTNNLCNCINPILHIFTAYNSEQMQQMFSSLNSERSELSSSVIVTDSYDELKKTIDFFAFFLRV